MIFDNYSRKPVRLSQKSIGLQMLGNPMLLSSGGYCLRASFLRLTGNLIPLLALLVLRGTVGERY